MAVLRDPGKWEFCLTLRMKKTTLDVGTWEMCPRHTSTCRHGPNARSSPGLRKRQGSTHPCFLQDFSSNSTAP